MQRKSAVRPIFKKYGNAKTPHDASCADQRSFYFRSNMPGATLIEMFRRPFLKDFWLQYLARN
jgi:hypothetical protein